MHDWIAAERDSGKSLAEDPLGKFRVKSEIVTSIPVGQSREGTLKGCVNPGPRIRDLSYPPKINVPSACVEAEAPNQPQVRLNEREAIRLRDRRRLRMVELRPRPTAKRGWNTLSGPSERASARGMASGMLEREMFSLRRRVSDRKFSSGYSCVSSRG